MKSVVYRVKGNGARTVPCGAPVLQTTMSDTHILWSVGEVVQNPVKKMEVQPFVLQLVPQKSLQKSKNIVLTVLPGFSR